MSLAAVGISHKTAPLEVRERFTFAKSRLSEYLAELKNPNSLFGAVILSTCNRTEIYAHSLEDKSAIQPLINFLMRRYRLGEDKFNRYFYVLKDDEVIRHIFKVAAGLDSQIIGETQILGQVKCAWEVASHQAGVTSELLDALFLEAVNVGKEVRLVTKISQGNLSVGSAAIKMLEEQFGGIQNKSVLVIGTGKIGVLACGHLKEKNVKAIFVSNRTYAKACELALYCGGKAINFDQLNNELTLADIVICATSSPHIVLHYKVLSEIARLRKKPLVIMDLALPRDVDPQAKNIPGITLFTLDDLKSAAEENYAERQKQVKSAEKIIEKKTRDFLGAECINELKIYI